jgi:hypothetical protein
MTAAERATERARNGPRVGGHGGDVDADIKRGPQPGGRDVAKRGPEIIADIWDHRDEPLVPLEIGGGVLVETYLGGIVLLIGGTGAGKTSLALDVAIHHAVNRGPAIVASLEMPLQIIGARIVGIRCHESWAGVLRGAVAHEEMLGQWPGRLRIVERRDATIDNLRASVAVARRDYPDEPVLVVVDYVQIMDNEEREIRRRIARAMMELDVLATEHRAVVLALSQGSRASSRQLASGAKLGRETADAGAEAAELERWSVYTIGIGGHVPTDGDWSTVDLSIGKGRIGGGDTVRPACYCGRTGAWRITGDAQTAAEVRAERESKRAGKGQHDAESAILRAAGQAAEPKTRAELGSLAGVGKAGTRSAAITALLDRGELVEVRVRANPRGAVSWKVWTRERAAAAGIGIIERGSGLDGEP